MTWFCSQIAGELLGDRYRLGRMLARGGMGVVYEAEHTTLRHRVAVKFLDDAGSDDPGRVARFLREARAAASLKSPHVARVMDFGTIEGRPFLVMERLEGEDLAVILDRCGALDIHEIITVMLQVCEAMNEAHARGIVHRDLKPANIFVTTSSDGRPFAKVLDFGLAKVDEKWLAASASPRTSASLVFGTPQYMSPEQLKSSSRVDARADVWSLGILLYELLTGSPPFTGVSLSAMIAAVLTEAPRAIRSTRTDVPDELEELVFRCLEKDPSRRAASVAEVARSLASLEAVLHASSAQRTGPFVAPLERSSETPVVFTPMPPRVSRASSWNWGFVATMLVVLGVGVSGVRAMLQSSRVDGPAVRGLVAQPATQGVSPALGASLGDRTATFEVAGTKLAETVGVPASARPPLASSAAPPPPAMPAKKPCPHAAAAAAAAANAARAAAQNVPAAPAKPPVFRKVKLGGK